jgi:predicted alpha/beta superfamily hydrolase
MKPLMSIAAITFALSACSLEQTIVAPTGAAPDQVALNATAAQLVEISNFASDHVQARNISIWLPPNYAADSETRYPVIYAHDGQNLFEPGRSYGGVEWGLDETAAALIGDGTLTPAIIVGIWNTNERWQEYAPQKVIESLSGETSSEWLGPNLPELKADDYLTFIVEELKPYIDATYATRPEAESTFMMGSSMGGLISLYALAEHPDTFSRAAAVSIHWPLTEPKGAMAQQSDAAMQAYLSESGLDPSKHTIWLDHGTETLDAAYPPHAEEMEAWFRAQGWTETQAVFRDFPGTDHSEGAWAARADQILTFLLSADQSSD